MSVLKIYTDGGSKGNPGPAAIGIVFYLDGKRLLTDREDIGIATNNDAEYQAVIRALEIVKQKKQDFLYASAIHLYSDSQLLVKQVNGLFKVKNARIREYIFRIRSLEQEIGFLIRYSHIPREENSIADKLVNKRKV